MSRVLQQSWFLLVLCVFLTVGLVGGSWFSAWAEIVSKNLVIGLVMLAVSLATDFRGLLAGKSHWLAVGLAIAINAGVAPPLGWLLGGALPDPLARGLVVAMAVPCTIASAIVWTRRGGGNEAAAAVVTLVTNFGCFLVFPFWTGLLLGQSAGTDSLSLATKLLACVAGPMLVGQLIRLNPAAARTADAKKAALGLSSQWGVLLLVLLGAVGAGEKIATEGGGPSAGAWAGLILAVVALHGALLGIGWLVGKAVSLPRAERLTLLIAGSQKTLAVGIGVALDFGPLALFPLVVYHFVQLVIDTLLVDRWRSS